MRQEAVRDLALVEHDGLPIERPKKRSECPSERPCPYVSCRYHLYLDITDAGSIKFNFPDKELSELEETCALDVAESNREGIQLQRVGEFLNVTRERVRQIEAEAKLRLSENLKINGEQTEKLIEILREMKDKDHE